MIEAGTSKPAPFDVVVVHSFSRFFRDHFELEFYVRKLAKNGVRLVSITQEMGDDPMHVMMRQIMALFDEYQSKENAKHVLRALKENARQGFWNGSLPPIGYRTVAAEQRGAKTKKKLEIDPLHADTIRLIYRLALGAEADHSQMGVKAIVKHLNARGIFTRDGGRWGIGQGRLALRFVILTAGRSGEVRGATWEEIDTEKALWTIPASRMKAQQEHVVPLSAAALAVLRTAEAMRKGIAGEPVFPGLKNKPMSDMTMLKALRTAIDGRWTVHGLRSSFRVWAAEATAFPSEAAEAALAHVIPSKVVKAYLRSDYLDIRRNMMTDWATFVGAGAPVAPNAA
jgi:integrase